jgi:hypothetical protein
MHETTPDETTADETTPDETTPDEGSATAAAGRPGESGETEWQRKRRLAAVFGDVRRTRRARARSAVPDE